MLPETRKRWTPRRTTRLPDLRHEMDRLIQDFFEPMTSDYGTWAPAADLYETDDAFVTELELPGFERDKINVTMEQGVLTVTGRRASEREEEEGDYHVRERSMGRFSRSFRLPSSINANEVKAHFENGILKIEMPKAAEARSRKIEVDVG